MNITCYITFYFICGSRWEHNEFVKHVFQVKVINFDSQSTSVTETNKAQLKFVSSKCHSCSMHFYFGSSIILVNKDNKMWTVHLDILEIFISLQLKKQQGDVEQDIQLCPSCYIPVTIQFAG
jgi:hypothetical protein